MKCEGGVEWWLARLRSGSGSGSGSMENIMDPDPWKMLWIRLRKNDADLLDSDPQHCHYLPYVLPVSIQIKINSVPDFTCTQR